MEFTKRYLAPLILLAALLVSWASPLDAESGKQVDEGLKRALTTFATARTLNAVISVLQNTDVAIQPGGVGIKLAPGQLLDPINDLVEKFSTLMLFASISFGIQKILIELGGHWLISAVLSVAVILWSLLHVLCRPIPAWMTKLMLITLALRFAIPIVTVGSGILYQNFLESDYAASQQVLNTGADEVQKLTPNVNSPESNGWIDRIKGSISNIDVKERAQRILEAAEHWADRVIRLSVIFLLQTLLFPLLLLWILSEVLKSFVARGPK